MDIRHEPELELRLTTEQDFDLLLYGALDYARRRLSNRDVTRLDAINRQLLDAVVESGGLNAGMHPKDVYSQVQHSLTGEQAELAVRSIDMFVQGTIRDLSAGPADLQKAGHGMEILDGLKNETAA